MQVLLGLAKRNIRVSSLQMRDGGWKFIAEFLSRLQMPSNLPVHFLSQLDSRLLPVIYRIAAAVATSFHSAIHVFAQLVLSLQRLGAKILENPKMVEANNRAERAMRDMIKDLSVAKGGP